LSPTGATAGGPAFTLTVNGTNFNSSSVVNFNGVAKATTFLSAAQITAAIAAADIATAGQVSVTVTNPAPGGGTTTNQVFAIVDFALTQATSTTVQITAGTPATVVFNLTTTPAGSALPADVNFTCAVPASLTSMSCALNPTKVSAGSTSGSTTLTITTMATVAPTHRRQDPWTPYLPWVTTTVLAGLMAIFFAGRQKMAPSRGRMAYLTLLLLVIVTAGLVGCATTPISTQKGASTLTVTSTSAGVSKTTTVNINVN
ncbi:MAG TPA: IPT/TIG domain-containing protein, partial [Terriglobales bacterium]|nr:IPT/TIG domain-containing protein [Terriglobales bacterium]